jgi:2-oxoglutarate ferredoxin oxidoreductase subunit delta
MPKVEISVESCKSCGYCVEFCPRQVLVLGTQVNSKGYEYAMVQNIGGCVACKACAVMCPEAAIEIYK